MSDFLKRRERWMRTDDESKYEKKETNNKLKQIFYKIWKEAKRNFQINFSTDVDKEGDQKSYAPKG